MSTFVSRAGLKLQHALESFAVDVHGFTCADFGCNVGGFTECLLRRGAARVYAVDTGHGTLAYALRCDARVVVMERTNALHAEAPAGGVDLVVIDLGWTRQALAIPAALRWLAPEGRIISLVKPHYELTGDEKRAHLVRGRLGEDVAEAVFQRVWESLATLGAEGLAWCRSPITGAKSARGRAGGNVEYLLLARRT